MNTFHVTLTVGTNKTTWSHPTRDLALARITALFVRESQLSVFERQHTEFTPTVRVQHTVFELEPMPMTMSALDALDDAVRAEPIMDEVAHNDGRATRSRSTLDTSEHLCKECNDTGYSVMPSRHTGVRCHVCVAASRPLPGGDAFVNGWTTGVRESIDKLVAAQANGIQCSWEKVLELLDNRLRNPPEQKP